MVQFAVKAGLLLLAGSQASDVADSGFLSQYMPVGTQRAPTSLNGYVPQGLSEAEYNAARTADKNKANQNKQRFPKGKATVNIADWLKTMEQKQTFKGEKVTGSGHTFAKAKFGNQAEYDKAAGRNPIFGGRFGKFILPAVSNVKHGPAADDTKDFELPKIAGEEEEKAAQKLYTNGNNTPITLSALGVGLLALAAMLGARMQRGLRAVSDPSAPLLGGSIMEMKSHGSSDKWHPMNLSSSDPTAKWQPAIFAVTPGSGKLAMIEGASNPFPDGWDPAGLAELGTPATLAWFRAAELKHSRVAMAATVGWIINEAGITFDGDIATGVSFASLGKGVQAWENTPDAGKLQILLAIGAIETASEFKKPHYMKGGDLGYIKGPFGLRLWDPLGTVSGLPG